VQLQQETCTTELQFAQLKSEQCLPGTASWLQMSKRKNIDSVTVEDLYVCILYINKNLNLRVSLQSLEQITGE